jgi:hypothetical protein
VPQWACELVELMERNWEFKIAASMAARWAPQMVF